MFIFLYSSTFSWWKRFPCKNRKESYFYPNKEMIWLPVNLSRVWPSCSILVSRPIKFGPTKVRCCTCHTELWMQAFDNTAYVFPKGVIDCKPFSSEYHEGSSPIGSPDSVSLSDSAPRALHPWFACYCCLMLLLRFVMHLGDEIYCSLNYDKQVDVFYQLMLQLLVSGGKPKIF